MSVGLDPDAYWQKTPREVALIFEGKNLQFKREHDDRAWLAWWTAAMPRMKKFPKIEKLLARQPSSRRPQTPDQQWAIFSAMAEASKVLRKN